MRVSIVGVSGAGKTTCGRRLADRIDAPLIELDAIYHQAGWTVLSDDEFRLEVAAATVEASWVCDGNYGAVRPIIWERATDVIWIDPPKVVVMAQVISRSVGRAVTRRELWNGNRELVRNLVDADHPIRWAWATFDRKREEYPVRFARAENVHLRVHRLKNRRQARRFLAEA